MCSRALRSISSYGRLGARRSRTADAFDSQDGASIAEAEVVHERSELRVAAR